jgi:hypothetical protein
MLQAWRADGYGFEVLEVWSVGYPTTEDVIAAFADGSDSACFNDTIGVFTMYSAMADDIFVIDAMGMVRYETNVLYYSLSVPENRAELDAQVRALLP